MTQMKTENMSMTFESWKSNDYIDFSVDPYLNSAFSNNCPRPIKKYLLQKFYFPYINQPSLVLYLLSSFYNIMP